MVDNLILLHFILFVLRAEFGRCSFFYLIYSTFILFILVCDNWIDSFETMKKYCSIVGYKFPREFVLYQFLFLFSVPIRSIILLSSVVLTPAATGCCRVFFYHNYLYLLFSSSIHRQCQSCVRLVITCILRSRSDAISHINEIETITTPTHHSTEWPLYKRKANHNKPSNKMIFLFLCLCVCIPFAFVRSSIE